MALNLRRFVPALFNRSNVNGQKAMSHMRHGSGSSVLFSELLPATKVDYAAEVGDGLGSSVLAAPLNFLMRTFPEAPPIVEKYRGEEWKPVPDHPLIDLLRRPNPFYNGRTLWMCTVLDLSFGEAYWLKIRNAQRKVIQLWWVPRATMTPKWPHDGTTFISHYEYNPGGGKKDIPVEDVVHLRFGLDPRNPRRGLSPLGSLMREIGVDDQAANFTAALLKNMGVIGVVISPEAGGQVNEEDLKQVKEYIQSSFTGDKRGSALALGAPTKVQLLQYNLQGFDVSPIRDVSEERICAAMGLPAAVIGFGTGLHQTKVGATMKEMRQLAWTGGIIPLQEIISEDIDFRLLPEFEDKPEKYRLRFDTSKVRALWEDNNEKHDRVRKDFQAKLIDRAEARKETGRTVRPEDADVYYSGPVALADADPTTPAPSSEEPVNDDAEAA